MAPLLAVIAFLIWRTDGAPILFAHYRVGKNGNLFRCWKFRSMRRDSAEVLAHLLGTDETARAEWTRDQKLTDDPRITRIGHFLRKTSLDELPQLINVMRGEMSLVGPRPVTVAELTRYGRDRWHYVSVTPGMTGLWQVSGRNNTTYAERVAFDREYV
ncbi:sugar transferase, partial [Xanthomonas citri pv. citri]